MNIQADISIETSLDVALPGCGDQVATHTGAELFDRLEADWRELENAAPETPFYCSYDWCRSWWDWFGVDGGQTPAVLAVYRDGAIQALMPLSLIRGSLFTSARLMGDDTGQYADCLVRPGRRGDRSLADAVAAGFAELGIDRLSLNNCRDDAAILDLLQAVTPRGRWIAATAGSNVEVRPDEFDGLEGYMKSRSSSLRKGLRRRRRKLAELGEVVTEQVTDTEVFACVVNQIVALKRDWLGQNGLHGRFVSRAGFDGWMIELIRRAAKTGRLHLSVIRVGTRICAAQLAFRSPKTLTAYFSAYDISLSSYAVGKLHLEDHIVDIFDSGVVLDLMPPSDTYKCEWGREGVGVSAYTLPLTWRGAAVSALINVRSRERAKSIYMALPHGVRAGIAAKLFDFVRWVKCLVSDCESESEKSARANKDPSDDR